MTAIAWTALGALSTKIVAQSTALPEMLSYTNLAIAVCASIAALAALARQQFDAPLSGLAQDEAAMFRSLADEMRFAETRMRSLALAKRFEQR